MEPFDAGDFLMGQQDLGNAKPVEGKKEEESNLQSQKSGSQYGILQFDFMANCSAKIPIKDHLSQFSSMFPKQLSMSRLNI